VFEYYYYCLYRHGLIYLHSSRIAFNLAVLDIAIVLLLVVIVVIIIVIVIIIIITIEIASNSYETQSSSPIIFFKNFSNP